MPSGCPPDRCRVVCVTNVCGRRRDRVIAERRGEAAVRVGVKSANSRHCGSTVDWTRGVGLTVLGDGDLIADMGPRNEALP
jgi:hypothetical protein